MPAGDVVRQDSGPDRESGTDHGSAPHRESGPNHESGRVHETGPQSSSLTVSERMRIERAVRNAEASSGLTFSVFLGLSEEDARGYAERLHGALPDPAHSVLVLCDPVFRALEIVTGTEARRNLDDLECRFAAASMESSFAGGDIVGGLVLGIQQLGESSRAPRTLHANN